jgi:DNA mismatch repair protein MutL
MPIIHVLPEHIANKIAAGEVIERPASIVKELIENSLDAGATEIAILIKDGGKSLIRVADNGSGMSADDAKLAIERHATSKISDTEDLDQIQSYGFRGEALPSIGAVSRMTLKTRLHDKETGHQIVIEGGHRQKISEIACQKGSIVEISDLFFNTPARRKFLRTDSTELSQITDVVTTFALVVPHVSLQYATDKKRLLTLPPVETPRERAQAIFGEELAKDLVPIRSETQGIKISGLVGKPAIARANRTGQIFFVNRRWIRSIALSYAVQDGYHGLLMHGQHPMAILYIQVDPERLDVNVHPTKKEIRISEEREVKGFIRNVISKALSEESDLAPSLRAAPPPAGNNQGFRFQSFRDQHYQQEQHRLHSLPGADFITYEAKELATPIVLRDQLHIRKVLGQIHQTYIIAETEEGMILVDQHAAHERVIFEELLKSLESENPQQQGLLIDEVLNVSATQEEILRQRLPHLNKLGFDIESFGDLSFVIRAVPAALANANPLACIKHSLEEQEVGKLKGSIDTINAEVAALIACKRRSVKAHDSMTPATMESLLKRLARCENPFNCPHGRPSFFQYSIDDLEKQFKRK